MARQQARNRLPYKSHPLYTLKRGTIITGLIGVFFNLICSVGAFDYYYRYDLTPYIFNTFLFVGSIAFVSYDLVTYAAGEALSVIVSLDEDGRPQIPDPDEETWPSVFLINTDLIFALVFNIAYWAFLAQITSGSMVVIQTYGDLASLVAGILHTMAFWKELMARKRAAWQRNVNQSPCQNCGHVPTHPERCTTASNVPENEPSGPSLFANLAKGRVVLPKWAQGPNASQQIDVNDRDLEAGTVHRVEGAAAPLLDTPDESTSDVAGPSSNGYGTMEQSVESLASIPETIVKKKGKGKKRLVDVD